MAGTTGLEPAASAGTVGNSLAGLNGISRIRRQWSGSLGRVGKFCATICATVILSDMACSACGSTRLEKFESEVVIHFRRLKDIEKRPVVLSPELSVCLACGRAEFVVPEKQLSRFEKGDTAHGD